MGRNGMTDTYADTMYINNQNGKMVGSKIINIDTIRGCPYGCVSCYAKKTSSRTIRDFATFVRVQKFTGKVHPEYEYRIGNQGDPCLDWKHSEELIQKYKITNIFVVTKLINLKGFTGFFTRLQVSVDPFDRAHFYQTLKNIDIVLKKYPQVKIVIRVRSCSTRRLDLMMLQKESVTFANMRKLPIMETRMRFKDKKAIEDFQLNEDDYEWNRSFLRPKHGLKFIPKVKRYYDCDLYGNHCANCQNCSITWDKKQHKKCGEFISDQMNGKIQCPAETG